MKYLCDKIWDCEFGEDELSCNNNCAVGGQWACRNNRECIEFSRYCDGHPDCSDASDESPECECHKNGLFSCRNYECISRLNVCDGKIDCKDGSDEDKCPFRNVTISTTEKTISYTEDNILYEDLKRPELHSANWVLENPLKLKIYPEKQSVFKNSDVVLQCRDEGDLRAEVEWVREFGEKMPKHAKQSKGRLEIKRIGIHEGGFFICRAIKYSNKRGGQVIANVQVLKHY